MVRKPDPTNQSRVQEAIDILKIVSGSLAGEFSVEHLIVAEPWDDRFECLKWAVESQATVKEMIAWHRAQNGLDLFEPAGIPPAQPDPEFDGKLGNVTWSAVDATEEAFQKALAERGYTEPEPQVSEKLCSCGSPCYINKKGVTEDFCLNCMPF